MQAWLARTGMAVFALVFAVTLLPEQVVAADRTAVEPASAIDLPALREIAPQPIEAAVPEPIAAPEAAAVTPAAATSAEAVVIASWYGPGFYGNRTACGSIFTPEILGVAHRTLPCGTTLVLSHGDQVVTVAVIDRGPYVAGRTLDLSNATKLVLGCTDLCTVRMRIAD